MKTEGMMWLIGFTVDMTEAALSDLMVAVAEQREPGSTAYGSIHGDDDDPRELVDIPEARRFCDLLLSSGFAGVLTPSSNPELCAASKGFAQDRNVPRPFGAFEVWATAEGIKGTPGALIQVDLKPFCRDMRQTLDVLHRRVALARQDRP